MPLRPPKNALNVHCARQKCFYASITYHFAMYNKTKQKLDIHRIICCTYFSIAFQQLNNICTLSKHTIAEQTGEGEGEKGENASKRNNSNKKKCLE